MTQWDPLVSVITPSYNYGEFLAQCLESVRRQTYRHIEHIVVDALSTDDSASVIDSFEGTYRIRATFQKDSGQADALNKGFAMAKGDVFCWLNADDYWLHEGVVEQAIRALAIGVDVVTAGGMYVDHAANPLSAIAVSKRPVASQLRYGDPILQPATLWRRSVHRPLRIDFRYAFDWDLFLAMAAGGARFRVIDTQWAAYRIHGSNKSVEDSARRRGELAEILRGQWGRLSPQHVWASSVFRGYRIAEALNSTALKSGIRRLNAAMGRLTRGRVPRGDGYGLAKLANPTSSRHSPMGEGTTFQTRKH
jgi:glycosyltransferase involved in cell wall biosynthesis